MSQFKIAIIQNYFRFLHTHARARAVYICVYIAIDSNINSRLVHFSVTGPSIPTGENFLLAVDQTVVTGAVSSPQVALGMAFASCFVFGIKYQEVPATFEFMQRFVELTSLNFATNGRMQVMWTYIFSSFDVL